MRTPRLVPLTLAVLAVLFWAAVAIAGAASAVTLENPIECDTLACLFKTVIRYFLALLALFATFVFIYGGFLLLTSGGEPERIKKGKETLFWATMGIVTVIGSWVFIRTVFDALSQRH